MTKGTTHMKHKMVIFGFTAIAAGMLSSCGGESASGMPASPAAVNQSLDTEQVLAQAKVTSETTDPYAVNGGMLVLTDTSDTTDTVTINGT
jgi:hypothetical protein